jgi:hypothetical protein
MSWDYNMPEMNLEEFHVKGFLLEANRQFFHPLGLALFVRYDKETGEAIGLGVYDWRHDLEGCRFEEITEDDRERVKNVQALYARNLPVRMNKFGYMVQPLD